MNDNYFNYNQIIKKYRMEINIRNIDNTYNNSIFHQILKDENIIELKRFLKNLNNKDIYDNQYNIISLFIKENRRYEYEQLLDLVIFLKELGIDFNIKNNIGYTPLSFCIKNKDNYLAQILINFEKDKIFNQDQDQDQNYIIHLSVLNSLHHITKQLLDIDSENNSLYKNQINDEDLTPLMIAVLNKDIDMINLLFQYDIDPNIQNSKGTTALMYACNSLNKNKYINNNYNIENTLIYRIINILINNGSIINMMDSLNQTALNYACTYIDGDTLNRIISLLDKGANPNICDIYGNTPLLNITQSVNYNNSNHNYYYISSIMMTLIKYGSDITFTNSNGYSIFDLMSYELNNCFNLFCKIYKKPNNLFDSNDSNNSKNKLFISKKCLICFEDKSRMIMFNTCKHSVTCFECYQILKTKEYVDVENNNTIKCPYCNINNNIDENQIIEYL